jgi:hypothetical protein
VIATRPDQTALKDKGWKCRITSLTRIDPTDRLALSPHRRDRRRDVNGVRRVNRRGIPIALNQSPRSQVRITLSPHQAIYRRLQRGGPMGRRRGHRPESSKDVRVYTARVAEA